MAQIPQNVAVEQLKQEIVKLINYGISEYHIPMYAIEYIMKDLYTDAHEQAMIEYENSVKNFQAQQAQKTKVNTDEQKAE